MSRDISDNEWDDAVRGLPEPPAVPRERMWQVIDEARRKRRQVVAAPERMQRRGNRARYWRMASAMAAILVLGVAIGRMTMAPNLPPAVNPTEAPTVVAADNVEAPRTTINPAAEREVYRLAAANLFGRADFLLTDITVQSCANRDPGEAPSWAGGMLLQTRLLLDTPVAEDAEMKKLLEELELVLAQIAGLSRDNCARDMAWIKQGLQERSTLGRLRIMSAGGSQGAL